MNKKICFNYNKKNICIDARVCEGLGMARGLMFRRREKAASLLFEFSKPTLMKIHSMFVFFNFVAVWLNEKNEVVDLKIVRPWKLSLSSEKPFSKFLEIPINYKNFVLIESLVGK